MLIILILVCSYMELSQKVDTDNIIEKAGMGLIVGGAGLEVLGNFHNNLIIIGAALYFSTIACRALIAKHNRRKADRIPKKRKLLS